MKAKKIIVLNIIISLLLCVVYIIVAARPLGHEYQFMPQWKIDAVQQTSPNMPSGSQLYFKLGQTMGYFTEDGKITSFTSFPFRASISQYYYASYAADASDVKFYTPDGKEAGTISVAGFPFFDEDRIFVFLPGGNSFASVNSDGSPKWSYSGTVPITAFDSSPNGCVAGFADGSVHSFLPDGKQDYVFSPGGSDYPIIMGAAISPSGEYIATISGRNRQRFVLAQKDGGQAKIVVHFFLNSDDPYQKTIRFSKDGSRVYYCTTGMVGAVSLDGKKHGTIPIDGHALSIQEIDDGIFVLSKNNSTYTVTFIENFATFAGSFSFEASTAFIETKDNMLFVGKDTTISHILIMKE